MFLYTLQALETPFYKPVLGQFFDKELALKAAEAALPHCIGLVVVDEWPITEDASITAPLNNEYIVGVECKRIYHKQGTRKLTETERSAHLSRFF